MANSSRFTSTPSAAATRVAATAKTLLRPTLALAFAALGTASAAVPYANDFATRSSGPAPSDRWMEAAYVPGALARRLASDTVNAVSPYAGDCQDGWAAKKGWSNGAVAYTVAADNGNQGLLANGTGNSYANSSSVIVQPFGNEFATGTLKLSVDVRTPAQTACLNPTGNAFAMLAPVFKSALDITSTSFQHPMRFGPGSMSNGSEWLLKALSRGKTSASAGDSNFGQYDTRNAIGAGTWIRYEAILNLDAGTYTATFANLGTMHPTAAAAAGTTYDFRTYEPGGGGSAAPTTLYFDTAMSDMTGGVAGLAFWTQGLKLAADAADAPMFDNVRVWHDGDLVYENDFATRRYRQVEPAATTAGAYALSPTTNSVSSVSYDHGTWENNYGVGESSCGEFLPATGSNGAECFGVDGWHRRAGGAGFSLLDPNKNGGYGWNNGAMLRVTKKSTLGVAAVPLGTTVTNGKVRLYFDLFPGRKTVMGSYTEAFAMCFLSGGGMGTATYTGSTSRDTIWKGKAVCGAGYYANGSANNEYNPGNICYGAGTLKANYSPSTAASMCNWHRYVVTADLGAKTYKMSVYMLGRTGQSMDYDISGLSPVAEGTTGFMTDAPASVDSLFIASQGHGDYNAYGSQTINGVDYNFGKFPCFDNLRVCLVNDDGSDGLDLFRCDFSDSVRAAVHAAAPLKTGIGLEGADRWTARGTAHGAISVMNDGTENNAAVLAGSSGGAGFAVQPFGFMSKGAASATFAADIRPPKYWSLPGGQAFVEVGGDAYYQGVSTPAGDWRATAPHLSFGFTCDTTTKSFGRYESLKFAAGTQAGLCAPTETSEVDSMHWYRVRVKAEPSAGSFSVRVYDQGTARPAPDSADGTPVATFSNVALPAFGPGGMTTFGLGGSGIPATYGGGLDDPTVALVDNLSADVKSAGTFYFLR